MNTQIEDELPTPVVTDSGAYQQAHNICITFAQCWTNVGEMLYKCFVFAGYYHYTLPRPRALLDQEIPVPDLDQNKLYQYTQ